MYNCKFYSFVCSCSQSCISRNAYFFLSNLLYKDIFFKTLALLMLPWPPTSAVIKLCMGYNINIYLPSIEPRQRGKFSNPSASNCVFDTFWEVETIFNVYIIQLDIVCGCRFSYFRILGRTICRNVDEFLNVMNLQDKNMC